MNEQYREFPGNWATDTLTSFIDMANSNVVATFVRDKDRYPLVSSIDSIYLTIVRALLNPQAPGGHLKFPHPWPGQIPPAEAAGRS